MKFKIGQTVEIIGISKERVHYIDEVKKLIGQQFKITSFDNETNRLPISIDLKGIDRWLFSGEFKIVEEEKEMFYKNNKRVAKGSKVKIVSCESERVIIRSSFTDLIKENIGNVFEVHAKDYGDPTMPVAIIIDDKKVWLYDSEFRHLAPKTKPNRGREFNPKDFSEIVKEVKESDEMKIIKLEQEIKLLQKRKMNLENKKTLIQEYTVDRVLKVHGTEEETVFKYKVYFYTKGKSVICEMHRIVGEKEESKPYAVGIANCHEEDMFDPAVGGTIAEARAMKQLYTKRLREIISQQY